MLEQIKKGASLDKAQTAIRLPKYQHWARYADWFLSRFSASCLKERYDYFFFSSQTFSFAGHFPFNPPATSVLARSATS